VYAVSFSFTAVDPVNAAYCVNYTNQVLQLVVSSLYISAFFSAITASKFARLYGRKASLLSLSFPLLLTWLYPVQYVYVMLLRCRERCQCLDLPAVSWSDYGGAVHPCLCIYMSLKQLTLACVMT